MQTKTKKTMATTTNKRGHRTTKTIPIQRRYTGFFKNKYINMELVPYLLLAGMAHAVREEIHNVFSLDDVAKVLNKNPSNDLVLVKNELIEYVKHELEFVEDYSADEVFNLLRVGATLLKDKKTPAGVSWQKAHKLKKAKHTAKYGKLLRYILNGKNDLDWYPNTYSAFDELLPAYDTELFVKLFALTSPRATFASNLKLALRAYEMFQGVQEFGSKGFLGSTFIILEQFKNGDFVPKEGLRGSKRKVNSFMHSILGYDHVTADTWMGKAFAMLAEYLFEGKRFPYSMRDGEYDVIETYIRGLSQVVGYQARQINAMIWLGIRQEEYDKHITTETATLLLNALKKHPDASIRAAAESKVIMPTPVHALDHHVECLDYSKPFTERVHFVKNSKPGSMLYRTFNGPYRKYCSGCSSNQGCMTCILP